MRIAGMPDYDANTLLRLAAQDGKIAAVFERHNYTRIEPPIIEPADVFVEQSGEDTRRHLYVFNDPAGRELCLRPDLTIPACRMYLRGAKSRGPARLSYNGPAFRLQETGSGQPHQFLQAGVECLGVADAAAADAEVLALTLQGIEAAGLGRYSVLIGDLGLFFGLIDRLELPQRWRERLKHQFWRPEYLRALLSRFGAKTAQPSALLASLEGLAPKRAQAVVEDVLRMSGIPASGGRSIAEIAERLSQQAADAHAGGISPEIIGVINAFFKINGAPDAAVKQIRALAKSARISMHDEIGTFERRLKLLRAQNIDTDNFQYAGRFGRTLEYYTGFVFEVSASNTRGVTQIAGGGRYDRLLRRLGAPRDIRAVGSAIRTEWLLAATGGRA